MSGASRRNFLGIAEASTLNTLLNQGISSSSSRPNRGSTRSKCTVYLILACIIALPMVAVVFLVDHYTKYAGKSNANSTINGHTSTDESTSTTLTSQAVNHNNNEQRVEIDEGEQQGETEEDKQQPDGCHDTLNWYNGYFGANDGKGWTCQDYATTGADKPWSPWCANGQVTNGNQWTLGPNFNFPEIHCCVCGEKTSAVSKDECSDTLNWYNGYSGANDGKGWTCQDYATTGTDKPGSLWCANGQATNGNQWTLGPDFNFPEKHCCVCGKETRTAAPWEDAIREQWGLDKHNHFLNQIQANATGIRVVFLGDSITQGWLDVAGELWNEKYAVRGAVNFGINGDRTQHILWRIHNGALDSIGPKLVVLKIGTNNIGMDTADDIVRGICQIVQDIIAKLPQTRLLLLSILPRNDGPFHNKISTINRAISQLDNGYSTKYLDLTPKFEDAVHHVRPKLYQSDLLHLSLAGYKIWYQSMETVFYDMLNN